MAPNSTNYMGSGGMGSGGMGSVNSICRVLVVARCFCVGRCTHKAANAVVVPAMLAPISKTPSTEFVAQDLALSTRKLANPHVMHMYNTITAHVMQ